MDQFLFRQLCGRFATGVTIVTTTDPAGLPIGMTINSFGSVSLQPPLISIAVDHVATMHPALTAATRFVVNVLEAHQESLSRRFANGLPDRFEGVGFHRSAEGDVLLDGALAHLQCEKLSDTPAGDHTIFIARVVGGMAGETGRPLLYYRGGYADIELP
jgi:flavin reductase (DIM6/NTAB) family NADH-FMN oxidoreductase RutF